MCLKMQRMQNIFNKNSLYLSFFFLNFRKFTNTINDNMNTARSSQDSQNPTFTFNTVNFLKSVLFFSFWSKVRVLYYINNWVYTTNHKRIAVNYFWFVILSGIVGMVLATVIRLEFAYPGVGIFAGDSIQYLSLASAHGVIMVFFMIMPLLFGAFANFLLPTQLGVHDVAFPRLNSAAFWFLPGGLLMLCQLVCVDRRYQRMNCFNIREIQSILKRKFFTDLMNTHAHHDLLNKTAIGLRFKTNNVNSINSNIFLFYNYGIHFNSKIRNNDYLSNNYIINMNENAASFNLTSVFFNLIKKFSTSSFFFFMNNSFLNFTDNYRRFSDSNFFFKKHFSLLLLKITSLSTHQLWSEMWKSWTISINALLNLKLSDLQEFFQGIIADILDIYYRYATQILIRILQFKIDFVRRNLHNFLLYFKYQNKEIGILTIIEYNLNIKFIKIYEYTLTCVLTFFYKIIAIFYEFFFIAQFLEILYFFNDFILFLIAQFNQLHLIENTGKFLRISHDFFFSFVHYFFKGDQTRLTNISSLSSLKITDEKVIDAKYVFSELRKFLESKNLMTFNLNNNFYKNLNYNSFLVHIYILIYIILTAPFALFKYLTEIFNRGLQLDVINNFYNLFSNWFTPFLLNENIISHFINNKTQTPNFNVYGTRSHLTDKNFNNFFNQPLDLNTLTSLEISSQNARFFWYFLNIKLLDIFSFLFIFLKNLIIIYSSLMFDFKTFNIFEFFYNISFINFTNYSPVNVVALKKNNYFSNYFNNNNPDFNFKYANEELSENFRYQRFTNPVFKYDYKSGDYFPKLNKEVYSYLYSTILNLTSGLRASPWFFSNNYSEVFGTNFLNYLNNVTNQSTLKNFSIHSWNTNKFNHTDGFFNFFQILSQDNLFFNKKWITFNTLNQKFYKMFNTSSMQQKTYSNWRQLKFTREAWRCKLLSARHQKTLFRRYLNEDGVFWSIERNAKDLIPGWAMITPFSSRVRYTAIGKTDIGLMGVLLVLNSSIVSAANFLVTYRYLSTLNNRKMRDARAFFTEAVMVASWMMILANPMLVIGIIMLLSDRHWQTSFFDYSGGGDTVLFQHMFWFFGHPEVYIIILPTFGFTNTMLSYYLRKRVSARASLLYSMYTIAFLGFFVWGHHMYMVGLSHTTRMLFSTLTVMISVPAATKIMHWCVTTVNSSFAMELPLLFAFTFIFFFVSGGISGMCVAHTGMDVLFHDTFYVIGHFHVMLAGGAMFASFGAFYFYFPAIFGVKFSRIYAYLHYSYYLVGQLMTIIPMFWLGYAGMPRRVLDYPASFGGWHSVISAGHMLNVAGLMAFFIMIFDSLRQAKAATRNTFGINRYNIRLNFYIYEIAKLSFNQQKALFLFKFLRVSSLKLNKHNYVNYEPYESTLLSYSFLKNKK